MVNPVHTGWIRRVTGILVVLALLAGNGIQAAAASSWEEALEKINTLHDSYLSLQAVIKSETTRKETLRKQNVSDLAAVNAALQATDQVLLSRLKSEAEAVQKKHAALLEQYSSLGKHATAARKAGNLKSATLLDLKRNQLKSAVTTARAEIKSKNTALTAAKAATAARSKPAKDAISPVAGLRKQVTALNKEVSGLQTLRAAADKDYKAAVKAGDAVTAAAAMQESYTQMAQIRSLLEQILLLEQKISAALRLAESKLPESS